MLHILLMILLLECLFILTIAARKPVQMLEFPFLAAAVYVGYLMPQLFGVRNLIYLPEGGLETTILMAILCLAAVWVGFRVGLKRPASIFSWRFRRQRLVAASIVLSVLGAFFFFKISEMAPDVQVRSGGQWTGIITIYVLFSKMLTVGLALAILLIMDRFSPVLLSVLLFDLAFYVDRIVIQGRRAAMAELALMVLMAVWFRRRVAPPRWVMFSLIVVGTLVINSIGDYRRLMMNENMEWSGASIEDIFQIDFVGNLSGLLKGERQSYDVLNAIYRIEAAERLNEFDYGLVHWNDLVRTFVPGQWVGYDIKDSLMMDGEGPEYLAFGYIPRTGTTYGGISDSFVSFWFFGFIKFFLVAMVMGKLYISGMRGDIAAQWITVLLITPALHIITHGTGFFIINGIYYMAFLIPVLYWSRVIQNTSVFANRNYLSRAPRI